MEANIFIFFGCKKDPGLQNFNKNNGGSDVLASQSKPKVISFLESPSKGDFGFEWDGLLCGKGDLKFKGYFYDTTGGEPISYSGKLWLGADTIGQGGKDVNYVYGATGEKLDQSQYMNKVKGIKLENSLGNIIFDTAIQIPVILKFSCPLPCVNGSKCLRFTTNDNLNFETHVAFDFNASLPENQDVESEIPYVLHGNKDEAGDGKVCFNGSLFDNIPAGATVNVTIVRSNYFEVTGTNGKTYRIYAYVSKDGTVKYCPSS